MGNPFWDIEEQLTPLSERQELMAQLMDMAVLLASQGDYANAELIRDLVQEKVTYGWDNG